MARSPFVLGEVRMEDEFPLATESAIELISTVPHPTSKANTYTRGPMTRGRKLTLKEFFMINSKTGSKGFSRKYLSILVMLFLLVFSGFIPLSVVSSFSVSHAGSGSTSSNILLNLEHAYPLQPFSSPSCVAGKPSYCPASLITGYDFSTLFKQGFEGKGQTIVIVDACGDTVSHLNGEIAAFDSAFHISALSGTVYTPEGKSDCSASQQRDWAGEIALDLEWSHAVAPLAKVDLVFAKDSSFQNLFGALVYAISHKLGNQISNSWGGNGDGCSVTVAGKSVESWLQKAASEKITVFASAGDASAWGQNTGILAQTPASCGSVTAVGGTTLGLKSNNAYSGESVWGEGASGIGTFGTGTGGGYAQYFLEPAYQSSVHIYDPFKPALYSRPDVSAVADPHTGVWLYLPESGGWVPFFGGTSLSSPLWAGFMADTNQWRASNGFGPAGLILPFLYQTVYGVNGGSSLYHSDFHDVTIGSNGWSARTGWDAATGLGTFEAFNLAQSIATTSSA